MWSFFSETRVRQLSVGWCALIIIGLFLSFAVRVLPSIGVAGLFLTSIGYSVSHRRIARRAQWPELLSFTLIYLLHIVTGLLNSDLARASLWQDLLLQLPLLLLPVAFLLLPPWRVHHRNIVWLVLIGSCLLSALGATVNYLLNQQEINTIYLQSKVMPTVPDHIRFSLLISMAVLVGAVLLTDKTLAVGLRRAIVIAVILLFVFQHLLAVRSGLATMYAGGVLWLAWRGWQQRRWQVVLTTTTLFGLLAGGCLMLFPTLQNKITNTRDDTDRLSSVDAANNYSVTARVYSYKVAWVVIREHPLLGVSKVKMNEALALQYRKMYPQISQDHYLMPHNQFIYNMVAYGLLGLCVFLVGFYYPLWQALRIGNISMVIIYSIVTISFLVEYTLETQIGILTGVFFLLVASEEQEPTALAARQLAA